MGHHRWQAVRIARTALLTALLVAALLPVTMTPAAAQAEPASPAFSDVAADALHRDAIAWLVERRITTGCRTDAFCPSEGVTRAQMAQFLHRYMGEPLALTPFNDVTVAAYTNWPGFADVASTGSATDAIIYLYSHGVTTGCRAEAFCPTQTVTRGQMAAFLWRLAGSPVPDPSAASFIDVGADSTAGAASRWLSHVGVARGVGGGRFEPGATVTRAQMASFLQRLWSTPPATPGPHVLRDEALVWSDLEIVDNVDAEECARGHAHIPVRIRDDGLQVLSISRDSPTSSLFWLGPYGGPRPTINVAINWNWNCEGSARLVSIDNPAHR